MKPSRGVTSGQRCEGSILIEVVVAVVLLAILIVPLAGGVLSAASRAHTVRQQADRVAVGLPGEAALQAWNWGSRIGAAWWRPGPTLHIRMRRPGDSALIVGLWVDGWFVGEQNPDAEGAVSVRPQGWSASAGGELVIRVRTPGGIWGPPWRSLVPGASGLVSLPVPVGVVAGAEGEVVAHAPAAGKPPFQLSWDRDFSEPGPLGLPSVLQTALSGPSGISLDGSAQCWWMEAGRELDVYF